MSALDETAKGIEHLGLEVFSPDWYKAYRAEHLRRHPHLHNEAHQTSIKNLDMLIRYAKRNTA